MTDTIRIFLGRLELMLAVGSALAYTIACLILRFAQSRFIFFPSRKIQTTPAEFNLPYQEVWLPVTTKTGKLEQVHGWWIPSDSPTEKRVILDCHGNRSNISANLDFAQQFHQMGLSVFLIDYRGYGRSTKRIPTETTVYEDVEKAWNYLIHERGINPHHIFVFGHSLGGAIAIDLASKHPEIAGLIIESSFTSIRKMVDFQKRYWMFPIDLLLTQTFNSISKVSQLKMPILFTHGTNDRVVPVEMSKQLFTAAIEPKQLLIVPGAGHNNVRQVGGILYHEALRQFIEQY
ncbi:MAG: alpha/beta fold hydrolase [Limnoraphis sp. WC205]|jgi:pimeloyl-ACP methyl ester carboxylesterase|nr:alpha/beta fold hydrolase [Limnoraphis sp. WC205]